MCLQTNGEMQVYEDPVASQSLPSAETSSFAIDMKSPGLVECAGKFLTEE